MLIERAHWYTIGLADSAQLWEGFFWPSPPYTPSPNKRGCESPHWYTKTKSLAWSCCPWPGCTGGWPFLDPPCAQSSPPLVTLGSACFLTPTPESGYPPFLYFLCPFLYSTLTWTGPAGTPSICNTFLSADDYGPCQQALPLFSLFCPGQVVMVQLHGS